MLRLIALTISPILLTSCVSRYEQNIKGIAGQKFCLNTEETKKRNNIAIGNGYLILNKDMTFTITNDSLKLSNITGSWDLCCKGSDWGNYVFKPENHIRQISSFPEMEVKVDHKTYTLIFTKCN